MKAACGTIVSSAVLTAAPLDVPGLGGELKPFQRAGVRYLLSQRRAFLADEQGLGKTIEALATLEADGAYPAIVVCPASLKLNWLRELSLWLPHPSAQALNGRYGELISEAARRDPRGLQAAALLATNAGRAYLLLDAAAGQSG